MTNLQYFLQTVQSRLWYNKKTLEKVCGFLVQHLTKKKKYNDKLTYQSLLRYSKSLEKAYESLMQHQTKKKPPKFQNHREDKKVDTFGWILKD